MPKHVLTPKHARAAALVSEGQLTLIKIAEELGVNVRTVNLWKTWPEFQERVDRFVQERTDAMQKEGIRRRENRLNELDKDFQRLEQVIVERGADPDHADVPGYKTGLDVNNVKSIGGGEYAERVDLYEVDTGLVAQKQSLMKQAAQEMGEWSEKKELTGKDGGPIKGEFTWTDLVALAAEDET